MSVLIYQLTIVGLLIVIIGMALYIQLQKRWLQQWMEVGQGRDP